MTADHKECSRCQKLLAKEHSNYAKKKFEKVELTIKGKLEVATMQSLSSSDFQ